VLGSGRGSPQANVMAAGAIIVGNAAGFTVIVLVTGARTLPQLSVAFHVSVTVPPQASGVAEKVDNAEFPLIRHPPEPPFVYGLVLGAGIAPQATVIFAGAIIVGKVAGLTVIVLETETKFLLQASLAVHVSVITPPQAPAGT